MQYTQLGATGLRVSRLALGLGLRGQGDMASAQRLVEHAIERGITLIDCANVYGPMDDRANIGRSEEIVGRAIKGKRDGLVLTSKVGSALGTDPNQSGLSRYHILREIDNSLRRLGTDHVDIYLLHHFDPTTPLEETVRALDEVVRSGKARYVGCCNFAAWQACRGLWLAERRNAYPFAVLQNPYSLLNRQVEDELFGLARDQGLGFMAYSPLGVGLLSGAYHPDAEPPPGTLWATRRREQFSALMAGPAGAVLRALHSQASALGRTPAQLALAWVLARPEVTCAISGADSSEQLDAALDAVGWELPADVAQQLDAASSGARLVLD